MPIFNINPLALLLAVVINMVLGSLWYSPLLFAKQWLKLTGKSESELKKTSMVQAMGLAFLTSVVMAFILVQVILPAPVSFVSGMVIGFWMWLGFVATSTAAPYIFERRPWGLYFINNSYNLISMMLMGGVLALWR